MSIYIDLLHLDNNNSHLLAKVFASNPDKNFWAAGKFTFNSQEVILSHRIVGHLNSTSEKKVYEVLDNDLFAKGCFGSLFLSKAILVPNSEQNDLTVKIKSEEKQRLVKIQEFKYYSKEKAEKEVQNLQKLGFFHCKPLSTDENQSFITMRKLPGVPLFKLIEQNQLTIEERYQLTKELVMALKEQIHNNGLIHRDIKPDNILITDHFIIYIVDLALAILIGYDDRFDNPRGAIPYAAPENYSPYQCTTVKSDIYALGRVLMMLWGDDYLKNQNFYAADVLYAAKHVSFATLFDRMDEIPACHEEIRTLLVSMLSEDQFSRPKEDSILARLESLSTKLQPIPNPKKLVMNRTSLSNNRKEEQPSSSCVYESVLDQDSNGYETSTYLDPDEEGYNSYYGF